MTIDFITGKAGTDHIDGNDWRSINASIIGLDDYVMRLRNELAIRVQDSNHVVIDTGMAMLNGGAAHVTAAETVTIQSGTQGKKRNDLVCLRYTKTGDIEKASLVCIKGTPTTGTPADPSYNKASTLLGSTTVHDMPLYRLPLNGITLGTPVKLFRTLDSLASVWDSLTKNASTTIAIDRSGTATSTDYFRFEGRILPLGGSTTSAMALINIGWTNAGSFHSNAWESTRLCKMTEWKPVMEGHQVACENADKFHYSMFYWYPEGWITWQTSEAWQVPENCWHNATFNFLVTRG